MKSPLTQKQIVNPRARMTKAERTATRKTTLLEQILDDIELPANTQDVVAEDRGRNIQIVRELKRIQRATEKAAGVGLRGKNRGWKQTGAQDFSTLLHGDNSETMDTVAAAHPAPKEDFKIKIRRKRAGDRE